MAFVTPSTTTSFVGTTLSFRSSVCKAALARDVPKVSVSRRQAAPQMAFTSIDDPSGSITLSDNSLESKQVVLYNAYRQIFGNAYLMASEREELATVESDFLISKIEVRDLVRAMAKSGQYRKRFFDRSGPYRFVELNCKHFLGRGPGSQEEVSFHVQKLVNDGYEAEIDSYFDSEEYMESFGTLTVPRFIYKGCYAKNDDFNRMNLMREHWDGCSTSTKHGSTAPGKAVPARLVLPNGYHITNTPAIQRGIRAEHYFKPLMPVNNTQPLPTNARAPVRLRIKVAENLYSVFETDSYVDAPPRITADWNKVQIKKMNGIFY